jgi:hypothetical protein
MIRENTSRWDKFFSYLLILSFILDPNNTLFHFKFPAFFLFFLWNLIKKKRIYIDGISIISIVYFIILSSTLNMFINNYSYVENEAIKYYTSPLILFVLLFISDTSIDLLKPFLLCARIVSVVTIVLTYIVVNFSEFALVFIYSDLMISLFGIEERTILGNMFLMVFHKSSPIIVVALAHTFNAFLLEKRRTHIVQCVLYIAALFFSGTRANMLSGILVILIIYLYYLLYNKRKMGLFVFFSFCISIFSLFIVFLLLTDSTSGSSEIKHGHTISINNLLRNNMNIFLLGNGPGSTYYSEGFHQITTRSELSYYELLRNYGIFSAIIIMFIYIYPLVNIFRKNFYLFSFNISYLAYLFIAGTNPLLMVPQGYMVLLLAYNYNFNLYKTEHI